MRTTKSLFHPFSVLDESDEFFYFKPIPASELRNEDLVKVSLLGDIQNVIVRDVKDHSDYVTVTVSEVGGLEYVTEKFAKEDSFLVSIRYSLGRSNNGNSHKLSYLDQQSESTW